MADLALLWQATTRKEVMDLLEKLWPTLEDYGREVLSAALLAGPGDQFLLDEEEVERRKSADRRVYDRLTVLERLGEPPLTPKLADRMAELRERYPEWRAPDGERVNFGSWTEMRWGPDTRYSIDDLAAKPDEELLEILQTEQDRREGLLDSWRTLAISNPQRAYTLLETLAHVEGGGPPDVWERALWGLRDAENAGDTTDQMMALLTKVPLVLFKAEDVVRGAADLLEAKSRRTEAPQSPHVFWDLFDRALRATDALPIEVDEEEVVPAIEEVFGPHKTDWVSEAVNRPLGRIATSFFNMLFARRPKVGEGIPKDLLPRLDRLISPDSVTHRHARVIAAARISYLYAIDPDWATRVMIPRFDWGDEEESLAMWQGYAWQARIDPQLWAALKPYFLPLFQPNRLARIGSWGRNIVQSLMLVGVAFGADEFKRDEARDAIRALPEELRGEAAAWIAMYMEAEGPENQPDDEEPIDADADARWRERVMPWIKKVWPIEPGFRTDSVAEQFALAAIGTEAAFPEAVATVRPYLLPQHSYRVLHQLNGSSHPEEHPRETLLLIDSIVAPTPMVLFEDELRQIVERIAVADQTLRDDNRYRKWSAFLQINQN